MKIYSTSLSRIFLLSIALIIIVFQPICAFEHTIDTIPSTLNQRDYFENILKSSNKENDFIKRWLWENRNVIPFSAEELQKSKNQPPFRSNHLVSKNSNIQSQNGWSPIGPITVPPSSAPRSCYSLGRINCVAFHPTNKDISYVGSPSGGVWKTENSGKSWIPLGDELPTMSISHIAIDPKNANMIYIATGDYDYLSRNNSECQGIFKSTDAGLTWTQTTLYKADNFNRSVIRKIIINPINTNEIIVGGMNGIWKSIDAGSNWAFKDNSFVTDLELSPQNPNKIYGSTGYFYYIGGAAGVIQSTNFGETWDTLSTGIPRQSEVSRVELAVSHSDSNYIYALCVNTLNGRWGGFHSFYSTTDAGKSWNQVANYTNTPNFLGVFNGDSNDVNGQGTYDCTMLVDPIDKNKVYAAGTNFWMTKDGGKSWDIAGFYIYVFGKSLHADHHFGDFNYLDSSFYFSNDGGLYRTKKIEPGSRDWISNWIDRFNEDVLPGAPDYKFPTVWENLTDGLNITEFYKVGLSRNNPDYVSGGSQDNSCYYYFKGNWINYIPNYDGMATMIDHFDPKIIYGVWQSGGLCRSNDGGNVIKIRLADTLMGLGERGLWVTPVDMDPVNSSKIYIGFRNLYTSTNQGDHWTKAFNLDSLASDSSNSNSISIIKCPYTSTKTMSIYKNAQWIQSPSTKQWVRMPGELWMTKDGGNTWNLSKNNLPLDSAEIISIDYDKTNADKMWIAFNTGYTNLTTFMTSDGGTTWINISKPLPSGIYINSLVHYQTSLHNTLFVGTNHSVYYTNDTLNTWLPFNENLPNVKISDLAIQEISGQLYAATYGRGMWVSTIFESPSSVNIGKFAGFDFNISPNPSNGQFSFTFQADNISTNSNLELSILDVIGRKVYGEKLNNNTIPIQKDLNLNLENGTYFIKINANAIDYVKKLVISK